MILFDQAPEFERELKKLSKKWRSLPNDINLAQRVISGIYEPQQNVPIEQVRNEFFSGNNATPLKINDTYEVIKMRLFCKDLQTNKMIRIVFIFIRNHDRILLIELYAHNDKNREDDYRIDKYAKIIEKDK